MKAKRTKIDELSAYRALFIAASILALVVGIFAIQNTTSLSNLDDSLAVGQYRDKAQVIKHTNDTQCLYGSQDPAQYDFTANKEESLDCLQYSRNLNSYYLGATDGDINPDFNLDYDFADVKEIMEFCKSPDSGTGEVKTFEIGGLGKTLVACKEDPRQGKYLEMTSVKS